MRCPECGADVPDEARTAHAEDHWPERHLAEMERGGDPSHFAEARRRKDELLHGSGDNQHQEGE